MNEHGTDKRMHGRSIGVRSRGRDRSANLKVIAGTTMTKSKQLRAGGLEPDESMTPGEYPVNCEGAMLTNKGRSTIAVLEFRIIVGSSMGHTAEPHCVNGSLSRMSTGLFRSGPTTAASVQWHLGEKSKAAMI
jgi:hypothetical protein